MKIIIAILIFCIIVLFHEFGHFLLAKLNGIRVNEFCIGFGPSLVKVKKGDTVYSIKLIPFGGACMMEGEDTESKDERAFLNKPIWARISVVFAGPLFNFIMAFFFALILVCCVGVDKPVLTDVIEGYAAEAAGMQSGDVIVKMDRHNVHFYREISAYSMFHEGEEVKITYLRDGKKHTTTLKPIRDEESGRYLYGFVGSLNREKVGFGRAMVNSVYEVRYSIYSTVQSLRMLLRGQYGINDLSGPVGLVQVIGDAYEESVKEDGYYYAFLNMLNIAIFLSANLGVMNLLPLPALDGGRLFFMLIELIRRKRIDPEKEGMVHFIGIMLLFALMGVVMFNDIRKIIIR